MGAGIDHRREQTNKRREGGRGKESKGQMVGGNKIKMREQAGKQEARDGWKENGRPSAGNKIQSSWTCFTFAKFVKK